MSIEMTWEDNQNRPGLVIFTCWAIWLVVIPVTGLAVARGLGMRGFWDAPGVSWEMPHIAILPLSLFALSTIGLWRMQMWGLLAYSFAGLLLAAMMILQPRVPTVLGLKDISNLMEWLIVAVMHAVYSFRLWQKVK